MEKASHISVTCMCAVFAVMLWSLEFRQSSAVKTYAFEEECGQEISMILDSVYQGQLHLRPRPSTPKSCVVTIETWYSMPHLMFYFVNLNSSCDDGFVEIADDDSRKITGLTDPVCGSKASELPQGLFQTSSQYLHINFTSLKQVIHTDILTIIFTAFSTDECRNDQYECSNGRCIHEAVRCNGYNSCGDNSDCKHKLSSVTTAGIVAASLVGLCILAAIISMINYHLYCKKKTENRRSSSPMIPYSNRSIGHHDDAIISYEPNSLSIISGQKPAYPRHWSYNDQQICNNENGLKASRVTENLHFWQEVDSNGTVNDVMRDWLSGIHVQSDGSGTRNAVQGSDTEYEENENNDIHIFPSDTDRQDRPDIHKRSQSEVYARSPSPPDRFQHGQLDENHQSDTLKEEGQLDDVDVCFEDEIVGSDGSINAGYLSRPDNDIKVKEGGHVRKITLLKINNA